MPTSVEHTIRVDGIDAPERRQPLGTKVRDRLAELTLGKAVAVTPAKRDKYGRTSRAGCRSRFEKGIIHMSVVNALLGNAAKVSAAEAQAEFQQILCPEERVQHAYKLIRDFFVFTDRRLILVDKQGLTGKKIDYHTIPYKSITHFSVETAGHFDLDAEMKIWVSGLSEPFKKQFNRQVNIYEVQTVLASYVLPQNSVASVAAIQSEMPGRQDARVSPGHSQPVTSDRQEPQQSLQEARPSNAESEAKALFEMARAAVNAKNRERAVMLLDRIVREYPDTSVAASARTSLGTAGR